MGGWKLAVWLIGRGAGQMTDWLIGRSVGLSMDGCSVGVLVDWFLALFVDWLLVF